MAMQMMLINKLPDAGKQSSREREMQIRFLSFAVDVWIHTLGGLCVPPKLECYHL